MTFSNASGSQQSNVPVQFGRVFLRGEIPNFPQVIVDSNPVSTQANVESRWPDGSVKHAILSFILSNSPSGSSSSFTFQNQPNCNCGTGTHLTKAAMLGANFDFDAAVTVGASTVSARAELTRWDGTTTGVTGPVQYWADGSISTTVILADHSTAAANDFTLNGYKSLRPIFICTFWPAINKVKVRFVLENSNTIALQDLNYGVTLTTGSSSPATVYTNGSVPHIAATRWTKVFWLGGAPDDRYNLDHNLGYLAATATTPNYDTKKSVSGGQIGADYSQWQGAPKISTSGDFGHSQWEPPEAAPTWVHSPIGLFGGCTPETIGSGKSRLPTRILRHPGRSTYAKARPGEVSIRAIRSTR